MLNIDLKQKCKNFKKIITIKNEMLLCDGHIILKRYFQKGKDLSRRLVTLFLK